MKRAQKSKRREHKTIHTHNTKHSTEHNKMTKKMTKKKLFCLFYTNSGMVNENNYSQIDYAVLLVRGHVSLTILKYHPKYFSAGACTVSRDDEINEERNRSSIVKKSTRL